MKAAQIVGPRRFEFIDVEAPTLKPGEVMVRMETLALCGSDLRTWDRTLPEESFPLPIGAPCHECVGVVEDSTVPEFRRGQRVIAVTNASGLVQYAAVPAEFLVPVPEQGDPSLWVLCQPVGKVIYACQRMGSVLGKRVVVLGQGAIGLAFTELLARQGASQVIVTDVHDYRLELARQHGATHTINAAREDVLAQVTAMTGGRLADVSVEACGRPEASHQAFDVLRREGMAVIFGLPHTEDVFPFDWARMYSKIPTMVVTNSAVAGERVESVRTCVDLVAQGRLDVSYMVSHRKPWTDAADAYNLFSERRENVLKVLLSV